MPQNTTIFPYLNPIEFWEKGFTPQAQFRSKNMNDLLFGNTILDWQEPACFMQQWQTNDSIRLQFRSTTGPNAWKLYKQDGTLADSDNFQQVLQNQDNANEYVYQADIDLSPYSAGIYYMEIELGVGAGPNNTVEKTLVSDFFELSEIVENSLLLAYSNSSFKDDVMFETDFSPTIRIKGHLSFKETGSKDVVYEDQVLNETMISSKNFELWDLFLSDERGIPDYFLRKIAGILGCDTLVIDGRYYTKSDGARLEPTAVDYYPMRGWRIEMREQLNRRSRYITSTGNANLGVAVVLNTDSKGFVSNESGGSVFQIIDIQ